MGWALPHQSLIKNMLYRGWRDGSVVKSTGCSSEGHEFKSQQPHGGSQPSVMRSDALFWCI
ncbi:mCG147233 [Mus musculus]|nr:mCG147233 [Mus musculus]